LEATWTKNARAQNPRRTAARTRGRAATQIGKWKGRHDHGTRKLDAHHSTLSDGTEAPPAGGAEKKIARKITPAPLATAVS